VEPGDVGVQAAEPLEHAGALLALEPLLAVDAVHAQYVRAQVAALRELHCAEAASEGLLAGVPQGVRV
jgi:hypothetical protein